MPYFRGHSGTRPIPETIQDRSGPVAGCILLVALLFCSRAAAFEISHAQTAHWYNPDRSGEGLVLEILSAETAVVYWFTYDEAGNQRWLIDVGDIDGDKITFPTLTETRGGRFGPDFNPDDVEQEVVGEAVLRFDRCDSGEWSFEAYGQSVSYEVVPLTETMAANCFSPNGRPGWPIRDYAGHSGSWYDPSHAGEGYTLQWMSRDQAALVWFSYDPDGNQYWMIGVGTRDGDQLVFPSLQTTTGGRFGEQFDSADVEATEWGSLVIELDCGEGSASYESVLPEFGSGEFSLSRLTFIHDLACPWTPPAFSDLYSVTYEEIPLRAEPESRNVRPVDISNQGEVAAAEWVPDGLKVWAWSPGESTLQELPDLHNYEPVQIHPEGLQIIAHDQASDTSEGNSGFLPVFWQAGTWSEWPGLNGSSALIERYSQDGSQVVGTVRVSVDGIFRSRAWRTGDDGTQVILPINEGFISARGEGISEDGRTAVGDQINSDGVQPYRYASIWKGPADPTIIRDEGGTPLAYPAGCNSDCSVTAGTYQGGELDPDHPNFGQAWLWVKDVGAQYLPRIDGAIEGTFVPTYDVQDLTRDGSMIVGRYLIDVQGSLGSRVFLWTQSTGMVTAQELFQAAGVGDDGWFSMGSLAISPNGRYLLVSGRRLGSSDDPEGDPRAAVITLTPR
ncbi:MAG: hypothetical protein GVY32_00635 [Gammaproteobacteria bacterium]|jgi:hypothetical protein|nr:hypothetical protein [Gammaproteobacteria bacterium]